MSTEIEKLPGLIKRAMSALDKATNAAEVLEAAEIAGVAYTAAKAAARLTHVKEAHDTLLMACHKMMGDALKIEVRAKTRLADEYDAAQERGEVARDGGKRGNQFASISNENTGVPTVKDLGIKSTDIHEARLWRDAEKKEPGIINKAIETKMATGKEPTRADVKRAVKGKPAKDKTERAPLKPHYKEDEIEALFEAGKTDKQISVATGLGQRAVRHVTDRLRKARDAVAKAQPEIDSKILSMTAQQKLDVAIRQHQAMLDAKFSQLVNEKVQEFITETILPKLRKEQEQAKQVIAARRGIMTKAVFKMIWSALHPDSRNSISDQKLAAAFDAFSGMEKLLLSEADSPTEFAAIPRNWAEMKARAEANRRAKRATSNGVRPR